jgi:hypothetical protein
LDGCSKICKTKKEKEKENLIKCHPENFRKCCHMDEHDLPYKITPMVCPK